MSLRCKYLARERMPFLSVNDDGRGAVGVDVAYRYPTILHRTRSRGGHAGHVLENHPVEAFVQRKLVNDFTGTGRAIPRRNSARPPAVRPGRTAILPRHCDDRYEKLMIPGIIFHMRKVERGENAESTEERETVYWMERGSPEEVSF